MWFISPDYNPSLRKVIARIYHRDLEARTVRGGAACSSWLPV